MTGGTICINRVLLEHPIVGAHNPEWFTAWVWLLCEAGWKDRRKSIKGKTVLIRRGQVAHSVRFMADALGWSKGKTERFITRLKTETMIETETGTGQNVITICNYDKYQLTPGYVGTETDTVNGTAPGQERDRSGTNYNTLNTLNTLNTKKESAPAKEKKVAKRKPKTPYPDNWQPDERGREYARKHWAEAGRPDLDLADQIERFRNYHLKEGKVMASWSAAWRTWVGNAPTYTPRIRQSNGGVPGGKNRTPSEQMSDSIERVVARRARSRGEPVVGWNEGDAGREDFAEGDGPVIELFPNGQGQFGE